MSASNIPVNGERAREILEKVAKRKNKKRNRSNNPWDQPGNEFPDSDSRNPYHPDYTPPGYRPPRQQFLGPTAQNAHLPPWSPGGGGGGQPQQPGPGALSRLFDLGDWGPLVTPGKYNSQPQQPSRPQNWWPGLSPATGREYDRYNPLNPADWFGQHEEDAYQQAAIERDRPLESYDRRNLLNPFDWFGAHEEEGYQKAKGALEGKQRQQQTLLALGLNPQMLQQSKMVQSLRNSGMPPYLASQFMQFQMGRPQGGGPQRWRGGGGGYDAGFRSQRHKGKLKKKNRKIRDLESKLASNPGSRSVTSRNAGNYIPNPNTPAPIAPYMTPAQPKNASDGGYPVSLADQLGKMAAAYTFEKYAVPKSQVVQGGVDTRGTSSQTTKGNPLAGRAAPTSQAVQGGVDVRGTSTETRLGQATAGRARQLGKAPPSYPTERIAPAPAGVTGPSGRLQSRRAGPPSPTTPMGGMDPATNPDHPANQPGNEFPENDPRNPYHPDYKPPGYVDPGRSNPQSVHAYRPGGKFEGQAAPKSMIARMAGNRSKIRDLPPDRPALPTPPPAASQVVQGGPDMRGVGTGGRPRPAPRAPVAAPQIGPSLDDYEAQDIAASQPQVQPDPGGYPGLDLAQSQFMQDQGVVPPAPTPAPLVQTQAAPPTPAPIPAPIPTPQRITPGSLGAEQAAAGQKRTPIKNMAGARSQNVAAGTTKKDQRLGTGGFAGPGGVAQPARPGLFPKMKQQRATRRQANRYGGQQPQAHPATSVPSTSQPGIPPTSQPGTSAASTPPTSQPGTQPAQRPGLFGGRQRRRLRRTR